MTPIRMFDDTTTAAVPTSVAKSTSLPDSALTVALEARIEALEDKVKQILETPDRSLGLALSDAEVHLLLVMLVALLVSWAFHARIKP